MSAMSEPCELPDGRRLFRFDYIVRLTDDHPMLSVAKTGKLIIWCFDHEMGHAAARTLHLFNVLPFQADSDVIEWDQNIAPDNEAYELLRDIAERTGYAVHFEADEAGSLTK
jgi:hypothetical protein